MRCFHKHFSPLFRFSSQRWLMKMEVTHAMLQGNHLWIRELKKSLLKGVWLSRNTGDCFERLPASPFALVLGDRLQENEISGATSGLHSIKQHPLQQCCSQWAKEEFLRAIYTDWAHRMNGPQSRKVSCMYKPGTNAPLYGSTGHTNVQQVDWLQQTSVISNLEKWQCLQILIRFSLPIMVPSSQR